MGVKVTAVPTDRGGMRFIQTALPMFIRRDDCTNDECGRYFVCGNCRPADWRNVEYAEEWAELGASAEEALEWAMDPMDVEEWLAAGVGVYEAHAFDDLALDVDDAHLWHNLGADGIALAEACFWLRLAGFDNHEALNELVPWVEAGHSIYDEDVYLCIRAGVPPRERFTWDWETLEVVAALRDAGRGDRAD